MLRWLWVTVIVIALDQLTKQIASSYLTYAEPVAVIPYFNFTLLHNTGAAFSFLSDEGGWQRWFFSIIALVVSGVIVVWISRLNAHQRWLAIALAFVLGGAVGNLWDRLFLGYVIDFIDLYYQRYHWPAFNIADSAIFIGAVMLIIDSVVLSKEGDSEPVRKSSE